MNRYRAGGPSKATPNTLCQKCLKKGHYTYECTAAQQERPYISRPSRSQQLSNPKLAPKLSATLPPDAKPAAKTEPKLPLAKSEVSRDRKRARRDTLDSPDRKRRRSISTHSSDSVSTISTNRSRSRSRSPPSRAKSDRYDKSTTQNRDGHRKPSFSSSSGEQRRRRYSGYKENEHRSSYSDHRSRRDSPPRRSRSRSLTPERRLHKDDQHSLRRRSRSRSRSPYRGQPSRAPAKVTNTPMPRPNRERSLSPYSQRLAMTKAMNAN